VCCCSWCTCSKQLLHVHQMSSWPEHVQPGGLSLYYARLGHHFDIVIQLLCQHCHHNSQVVSMTASCLHGSMCNASMICTIVQLGSMCADRLPCCSLPPQMQATLLQPGASAPQVSGPAGRAAELSTAATAHLSTCQSVATTSTGFWSGQH